MNPGDVLLTDDQFGQWNDQRYVLETLVEDAEADLAHVADAEELATTLRRLTMAIRDSLAAFPEPSIRG